jgi:hypothetical protein
LYEKFAIYGSFKGIKVHLHSFFWNITSFFSKSVLVLNLTLYWFFFLNVKFQRWHLREEI